MPLRSAVLSGQAPQPRERCAEGAGLDGSARPNDNLVGRDNVRNLADSTPVAGSSFDLPEVTAFSSRFDAVIGAG